MSDKPLLTEIERQKKYLAQLPKGFSFPLFNSKKALESQRQSGYRSTAAAAREIVDNAIEAQATKVHMIFDRPGERSKHERKERVSAIAFVDNGSGMLPEMARYALSWGGGTHFEEHEFIGKFGFGLPNASINQARRVEVYTRTDTSGPWMRTALDIDEYTGEGASQDIAPAVQAELPEFVQRYLKKVAWDLGHGTVVVWARPDRLTYRKAPSLREHLLDDFGVTYRYLLKDFELKVEDKLVEAVDPLFLDPKARFYRRPDEGGAQLILDEPLAVKFVQDQESGEHHLMKVTSAEDLKDPNLVTTGRIHLRVARFPLGLVVGNNRGIAPLDDLAKKRFEIRKTRRGMSFVRAGREVETVDVFPRRASDVASGLGDWPLLQSYAYHWGIEVSFSPSLDSVFGITNDKQTVRPVEDFWRLLAQEEIDALLTRENTWQSDQRRKNQKELTAAKMNAGGDEPTPAEAAASLADVAQGDVPLVPEYKKEEARENLERKVKETAEEWHRPLDEVRDALIEQQKVKPYAIDYFDDERGPFYVPEWLGKQVVVRINRKHPFFTTLYGSIAELEGGGKAKEAVDVLLIALARSELKSKNPVTAELYREQRENRWSPFLATALRSLERQFPEGEEEEAA